MQKRNRNDLTGISADPKERRAIEAPTWELGTITLWDSTVGSGRLQPVKTTDRPIFNDGQYYFEYTMLEGVTYKPKVGDKVCYRVKAVNGFPIAELMEIK
jgi:hypothetical protein